MTKRNLTRCLVTTALAGAAFAMPTAASADHHATNGATMHHHHEAAPLIPRDALFGNPTRASGQISPDGKWLSWLAPKDGVLNVWMAPVGNPDDAKVMTDAKDRPIRQYFWSPDSQSLLYIQDKGGDVFVLNMGDPVKIRDLATRMIYLMGLTVRDESNPDGDIEIKYTGLRPAEKLYEELLIGSNVTGTQHSRIMRAEEDYIPYETLTKLIDEVLKASRDLDRVRAREVLLRSVHGYDPQNGIEDLVWVKRTGTEPARLSDTIVDFKPRRS